MDAIFGIVTGQYEKEALAAAKDEVGLTRLLRGSPLLEMKSIPLVVVWRLFGN